MRRCRIRIAIQSLRDRSKRLAALASLKEEIRMQQMRGDRLGILRKHGLNERQRFVPAPLERLERRESDRGSGISIIAFGELLQDAPRVVPPIRRDVILREAQVRLYRALRSYKALKIPLCFGRPPRGHVEH